MLKLLFALFCIFTMYIVNCRKKQSWMTPSSFLVLLYLVSLICGVIDLCIGSDIPYIYEDEYIGASLLFIFLFCLFLGPFVSFREDKVQQLVFPNIGFLNKVSSILIILSFAAIIYYIPSIKAVFSYGNLSDARNDRYIHDISFVEVGLSYTFFSVVSSLFVFCLLLFFIYYSIGGHKKRCILLLIASLSETFHMLTEVGRDGAVFWAFTFIFFLFLFKNYLEESKFNLIIKYFTLFASIIFIPFLLISLSRFSGNVFAGLVSYMGQQFKHFCYYVSLPNRPESIGYIFPLFWEIIGEPRPERASFIFLTTDSGAFGTFLRSLVQNLGIIGTIIVGASAGLFFKFCMKNINKRMPLYVFFIYILYFEIYAQGVFYFRQYTRGGNLFIILCIAGYLFFKKYANRKDSVIISRKQQN